MIINPNALSTKIAYSKFYSEYYDIFRDFARHELTRCEASLFELTKEIQSLSAMRRNPKSLK